MFWKKRKKSNESKQIRLIEAYLAGGMPLIANKLASSTTKTAVQIFILGMADMLRQSENQPWEEYVSTCRTLFSSHNLTPPNGTDGFIENVTQIVGTNEDVARIMRYGAQSIEMYVVEKDANAPTDLLSVAMSAESNASQFEGI